MSGLLVDGLTVAAAVGAAVSGGLYFTFSSLVMPAVRALPADEAVRLMQRINRRATRRPFLTIFCGGAAASIGVLLTTLTDDVATPTGVLRTVGAVLSLGSVAVTVLRNVPLNTTLALTVAPPEEVTAQWTSFAHPWTRANAVRTAAALTSALLLSASLL